MRRRKFIKLGLFGSSSLLAYSPSLGTIQAPSDTLNVGVIGTGSRGQGLLSLINKVKGINTIACCDILPFRLEKGLAIPTYQLYSLVLLDLNSPPISTKKLMISQIRFSFSIFLRTGKYLYQL